MYRHPAGWCVVVSEDVVSRWRAALGSPLESGGVLLGNRYDEGADLLVAALTEPQLGDRRGPVWFYRDARQHQHLVNLAWEESDGKTVYLGEWHTHTSGGPAPSTTDVVTWTRFVREAAVLPLIFVLVAPGGTSVWGTAIRGQLSRLVQIGVGGGDHGS